MKRTVRQPWCVDEILHRHIEAELVHADSQLFFLLAAASFVEITSHLYNDNLLAYFAGDNEMTDWLREQWLPEELRHGNALKRYVNGVWPEFDWAKAYREFFADYSRCSSTKQLGPTRALEMVSRCLVETGTSCLYTMISRLTTEPVLRLLMARMKDDEVYHYKHFYRCYLRYRQNGQPANIVVLRTLYRRIAEIDGEDGFLAFKYVFEQSRPRCPFTIYDYRMFSRHFTRLAKTYFPYTMATKMFLQPMKLPRWQKRIALPLLCTGAKYLSH
ncbi:MAG TPA: ferritin-like domain-containing protein [Terriglobales bacterium]|jgi:hypothetical protein|nr:ferritin-like domain-containing protein [Terriglobales bacterium]